MPRVKPENPAAKDLTPDGVQAPESTAAVPTPEGVPAPSAPSVERVARAENLGINLMAWTDEQQGIDSGPVQSFDSMKQNPDIPPRVLWGKPARQVWVTVFSEGKENLKTLTKYLSIGFKPRPAESLPADFAANRLRFQGMDVVFSGNSVLLDMPADEYERRVNAPRQRNIDSVLPGNQLKSDTEPHAIPGVTDLKHDSHTQVLQRNRRGG